MQKRNNDPKVKTFEEQSQYKINWAQEKNRKQKKKLPVSKSRKLKE